MEAEGYLSRKDVLEFLHKQKKFLAQAYGFKEIFLFGSYARGKQNKESDIDLLVNADKKDKTYKNFLNALNFISSNLHTKVDLVFVDSLNPIVASTIQDGVIKIE